MYPEQLENHQRYQFINEKVFPDPLELVRGFIQQDYNIGMHTQDFFEINIVLNGSGMHYIENRKIPVRRGDVFIIPPDTRHGYVGEKGFDVYHLLLSRSFMQKYTADLQKLPSFFFLFKVEPLIRTGDSPPFYLQLSPTQFKKAEEQLLKIKDYAEMKTVFASVICNSLTVILITSFCEIYTENADMINPQSIQYDAAFANALAFIYERYSEKISIATLAKIAHLSRSSFIQKFNDICKMSPAKFILQQRVEAAKQLLIYSDISIADIAGKTGFYDTSHFIKVFTAEEKATPKAYRKAHSKSERCSITK